MIYFKRIFTFFPLDVRIAHSGFTVIELMIAMTISIFLSVQGIASYMEFNSRQSVINQGLNLKANLISIREQALAGKKPVACGTSTTFSGYQIDFSTSSYQAEAICDTSAYSAVTYNLDTGFTISNSPSNVLFQTLGNGADRSQVVTITKYQNPSRYYSLCISTSGDIVDCGYSRSSPPSCSC